MRDKLNQNTVTVISGNPNGTYLFFAYDMSAVLDDGDNLRVLPVVGKGAFQNVKDILHLRGVDLGITQSDIMSYLKKTGVRLQYRRPDAYIAKLYNEEMHILAGPGINTQGSGWQEGQLQRSRQRHAVLHPPDLRALGIKPGGEHGAGGRLPQVKSGEIAATVLIGGKPTGLCEIADRARTEAVAGALHRGTGAGYFRPS